MSVLFVFNLMMAFEAEGYWYNNATVNHRCARLDLLRFLFSLVHALWMNQKR